ncbi:MAG: VOC family protein [Chloroflexi bacterium]|nr:VOC family protein [Chloroflexota bacterium]
MPILSYLNFDGNCREALEFYRSVFDGEYMMIMTFGEAPDDIGLADSDKDKIMHATLMIGDGAIMASDTATGFGPPLVTGNNFSLNYPTQSKEETDELFAKMSEGGTVTMPLEDQFWGSYFGACTDKFGINWQFNYEMPRE